MRARGVPYAQCQSAATLGPWELLEDGRTSPLPEVHPAWDAGVDLRVSRTVTFDGTIFAEKTKLGDGAQVRLVAGFDCEHARSRHFSWTHDVVLPSGYEGTVAFAVPAGRLAVSVDLVIGAVLVSGGRNGQATRARVPGSWLWTDRTTLGLDGGRSRFPMEWTDFGASGLPRNAAWYLEWATQDWSAPSLGTVRLLLNSRHPALSKAVNLPDADPRRHLVIHSARFDVAKQMMMAALSSDEFLAGANSFEEGSVGSSVALQLRTCFQGEAFSTLRERMVNHAGEFHAQMQSGFGAFDLGVDS